MKQQKLLICDLQGNKKSFFKETFLLHKNLNCQLIFFVKNIKNMILYKCLKIKNKNVA